MCLYMSPIPYVNTMYAHTNKTNISYTCVLLDSFRTHLNMILLYIQYTCRMPMHTYVIIHKSASTLYSFRIQNNSVTLPDDTNQFATHYFILNKKKKKLNKHVLLIIYLLILLPDFRMHNREHLTFRLGVIHSLFYVIFPLLLNGRQPTPILSSRITTHRDPK